MSVLDRIKREILTAQTKRVNAKKQKSLTNRDFTLVCNNCTGGVLLHDFGLQFKTPFVNESIYADDFFKLTTHLEGYMAQPLVEKKTDLGYPVAMLGDVMIRFPHSKDFAEVKETWDRRAARIRWDNIFVLWVAYQSELAESSLERIAQVPYPKVVLLNHDRADLPYCKYIKGFETQPGVGHVWQNEGLSGKKYYDQFDFAAWFNANDPARRES